MKRTERKQAVRRRNPTGASEKENHPVRSRLAISCVAIALVS
jgi:hypothetical protein